MELTNLKYFYEVAKIEHVTKASENLHIAQPALTKSIKLLENELGVKLFIRVGRRIKLTDYGRFLLDKIEPIIKEIDVLPITIEKMTDISKNTIKINVLCASTIVTDIIIKFKKENPDVIFKMTQKENDIDSDIYIYTNSVKNDSISKMAERHIVSEKIYIAVPETLEIAKKDEVNLQELKNCDFVALSGSRRFRPLCDSFCEFAGFKPKIVFESDSLISVKNLISAGIGVAFWPEFSWGKIAHKNIKLLNIKNPDCQREIILYKSSYKSDLCEKFYEFLFKELKNKH